jgi:uncharacterized membrane protein YkvA (DUF1232 family)
MLLVRAKQWYRGMNSDVLALWLAARDPRTPWYAKAVAASIAAYALSPIDLIPDFIPVLGYLDELLIIPLGIALAIRLIPADLMIEFRREANQRAMRPRSLAAATVIVAVWLLAIGATAFWAWRYFR